MVFALRSFSPVDEVDPRRRVVPARALAQERQVSDRIEHHRVVRTQRAISSVQHLEMKPFRILEAPLIIVDQGQVVHGIVDEDSIVIQDEPARLDDLSQELLRLVKSILA